ncbi:MAG: SulP family inorganic anion transporter, partial [Flavobacteriales bacterium]|nr:SulP family inorganic anion transporter [Flavobacteriales bacterium]
GQSIINVNSGGRGRLSGVVAAISLLCFILFAAPLIEQVPIAALVGVMFMVVIGTFAWKSATMIRARKRIKEDGTKVYEIWGPLFFGSSQTFSLKFDAKNDPQKIEIDFIESKVTDHSGIEAIRNITSKYLDLGKEVKLTHLSPECITLMLKANPKFVEVIETSIDDPRYHVVTDMMDSEI